MKRPTIVALVTRSVPVGLAVLAAACKGPEPEQRVVPLNIPDQGSMAVQWPDGPRRDNAELVLQKSAEDYAGQLFKGEPMARDLPPEAEDQAPAPESDTPPLPDGEYPKPAWADGVPQPAEVAADDMPRAWPIEVRLGETPVLLGEWSGADPKQIITDNEEMLGKRRWLKTGDRISVTMTPNQKIGFDRARDAFQKQRVDAFFSRRYFEKVVVYRVKKGEYISAAAKRYGDVPLWLIEEFNQTDFRGLQPGDEILIPIVSTLEPGQGAPPPLTVVDEEGHPIAQARTASIDSRLKGDFMARARLALDDSNVFMRPRPAEVDVAAVDPWAAGAAGQPGQGGQPAQPSLQPGAPAAGAPGSLSMAQGGRPERQLPAASIGSHDLLPDYGGGAAAWPAPAPAAAAGQRPAAMAGAQGGVIVEPAAAVAAGDVTPRDIVVKRGESLMHYVKWSKTALDDIKVANPHLHPERIFVGARVAIPMSDAQYVAFVKSRAAWEKDKDEGGAADAKPAAVKKHTVKAGDTATSLARHYKIAVKALKAANPKVNLKKLKPGTKLVIPTP